MRTAIEKVALHVDPGRSIFLSAIAKTVEALAGTAFPECDDGGGTGRVVLSVDILGLPYTVGVGMTPRLARHFARCLFQAAVDCEQSLEWEAAHRRSAT